MGTRGHIWKVCLWDAVVSGNRFTQRQSGETGRGEETSEFGRKLSLRFLGGHRKLREEEINPQRQALCYSEPPGNGKGEGVL